ncbi:HPP family protein [Longimicrobium sp.]|jgi:CBS-domain-containing membrane protein|uniref:HPP family protein n=1 Tax=Longimicrobium sp. TaxID=2029185 RepID=UPI0032C23B71
MGTEKASLRPGERVTRVIRQRLHLRGELMLAALPTATVLLVLYLVETLSEQRLLFASLASSAFLIYMDPEHGTNRVRTLVISQISAALIGLATFTVLGPGYDAGALAMVLTILLMIVSDAVHPPAVSTALSFSLRAGDESNVALFGLAVAITAALVLMQRAALWMLARHNSG